MTIEAERELRAAAGHGHCLLCGAEDRLGLGLRFRRDGGTAVRADLVCRESWQGYDGRVHGGMIASLLDVAMTHCLFLSGVRAVTGEMRIRYLHPIPCDARLELRADIARARPPLYRLRAELAEGARVLARSEASFLKPPA